MVDKIFMSIPSKSDYVSVARLTSSVVANKMGFDIEDIDDIKVAVSEACNNVVLHSKNEMIFDLSFIMQENKLEIEIVDKGNGFSVDEYEAPNLEDPKEGGLGIFIMRSLMDDLEINSDIGLGTTLKMTKYLDK